MPLEDTEHTDSSAKESQDRSEKEEALSCL